MEKGKNLPSVYTAAYGSRHDFTASASPAWHLAGWRIEKEGNTEDFQSDTLTWSLQGGEILTALFDTNSYRVSVEAEGLPLTKNPPAKPGDKLKTRSVWPRVFAKVELVDFFDFHVKG